MIEATKKFKYYDGQREEKFFVDSEARCIKKRVRLYVRMGTVLDDV